jgi:hypothetical protein
MPHSEKHPSGLGPCGRLLTLVAAVIFSAVLAHAGALTYNESSNYLGGVFPSSGYPNIGTLGLGLNEINGEVSGASSSYPGLPQDDYEGTFSVTLPTGLVITSAALIITNFNYGADIWGAPGGVSEPLNYETGVNANGIYNLTRNAPYSISGSLDVDTASPFSCNNSEYVSNPDTGSLCSDGGLSYSLQYTVASSGVPEPSTGVGLLTGLGLLAFVRRRSKITEIFRNA